jgi:multiple antibiotic resistance protein
MVDFTGYLTYFIFVFASIFVIVNPLQASLVFVSLTSGLSTDLRRSITMRATTIAFIVAIVFAIGGDLILRFFGITVDSLRVAGGILLFQVAMDMLRGGREHKKVTDAELQDASARENISIFPLATPLITGPGAMTTVVVQMGAAQTLTLKSLVLVAIVITFLATYLIFRSSEYIEKVLGVTGIMVLTRIQGLILGAIAVNFVATGTWNLYMSMMRSGV